MKVLTAHTRAITLELVRYPGYVVPTLLFPTMFFLFFAAPRDDELATLLMVSFAGFAALGVAFFQFGVGIANDRVFPWERYLRTLPVSPYVRLLARVLSACLFAAASAGLVVAAALATTEASLGPDQAAELVLVLLAAIVSFGLLGIALGYLASPKGALPIANLLYLGLSYGGGLWMRPGDLPAFVRKLSPFLPTRQLADALTGVATHHPWQLRPWLALAGFTAAFAVLALTGYRRDEGERFR